jgi:hypothetical protein
MSQITQGSLLDLHEPVVNKPLYRRMGLWNGLAIGAGLALGAWAPAVWTVRNLPVSLRFGPYIISAIALLAFTGAVGWLTARIGRTLLTALVWFATACVTTLAIGYAPYSGGTLAVWLADRRFWGLPIYPFPFESAHATLAVVLGGLLLVILLTVLALLQDSRLEAMVSEMGEERRLNRGTATRLLLPVPLVILVAYLANDAIGSESWRDLAVVDGAVSVAYEYDGDLFALSQEQGVNYNALRGVRDLLGPDYTLESVQAQISDANPLRTVAVHFDNGSWIHCQFLGDALNFCYDAAPPYTTGLATIIAGTPFDEECRNCYPRVGDEWAGWLRQRAGQLGGEPEIRRLAQRGNYTLMEARSAGGDFAVTCRFVGARPVEIEECWES